MSLGAGESGSSDAFCFLGAGALGIYSGVLGVSPFFFFWVT